jgi:aminomethyltransferase
MPVQYSGIVDEHLAVRQSAGMFDISHMGEVLVSGPGALAFLNHFLTNDLNRLTNGLGHYSLMCNPSGGVIDDLYVFRLEAATFLLIINASRIGPDVRWLENELGLYAHQGDVTLVNVSEVYGAVAIQGPRVVEFIDGCFPGRAIDGVMVRAVTELKKNELATIPWGSAQTPLWISRTGYTGEDGFEVVAPAGIIDGIWNCVLDAGKAFGLKPAGLGARDTLRTEACYPLYGHELDEQTTPIEAGLGFFVSFNKGEFVGRRVLEEQKREGARKKLIAFRMPEKSAPPRPHYPIWSWGEAAEKIGETSSGTQSPTLNTGIGMGYVPPEFAAPDTPIQIEIRGRLWPATVVKRPFYRKPV